MPTGGSAGGNLAAAVAIKLRDLKISPQPKAQVLLFPLTQAMDFNLPSFIENEHDPVLYKELTIAMWLMYATGKLFITHPCFYNILRRFNLFEAKSLNVENSFFSCGYHSKFRDKVG